jgi:phosphatidate cytidylyltransferase
MLKLRILSALVLVPLIIWALFAWPPSAFATLLGVFILIGGWEWTMLAGMHSAVARVAYVAALGAVGYIFIVTPAWTRLLLALAVSFWLWAFIELVSYRDVRAGFLATRSGKLIAGFLVLLPAWIVPLALLREAADSVADGRWLALYVMVVVWTADTGAYFAGHRYGRHKLAPAVSPGKTWEGVAGGLVAVLLLALAAGIYGFHFRGLALGFWVALSVATAFVSVLGDLFESRVKRAVGVKDSGTLIPGHGGVLDRIDAFTAAAPVFALVWLAWRIPAGAA